MSIKYHTQWPDASAIPSQGNTNPFTSNAFLRAFEQSGSCTIESGWQPNHIEANSGNHKILAPCYIKTHSWGEYVFDWAWAQAYEENGLEYYPKLLIAIPYTPSQGPRLLGAQNLNDASALINGLKVKCQADAYSGFHILYPNPQEQEWLDQLDLLKRNDVQFHWHNRGYNNFDDFLALFTSRKRKNVRKERTSIEAQGIHIKTLEAANLTKVDMDAFYYFYHATYLKRGRQGYLNRAFFETIQTEMPENLVLFMAYQGENPVAGALCFKDDETLYGRYWGCIEEFNNLHFETCYYQGIDYCIKHNLKKFDPGTQGEHKIARGFEPTLTTSYHWLIHEGFMAAADNFCEQDRDRTALYFQQATQLLPFKQTTKEIE
jgi:predicted N-acyltransferase